MEVKFEFQVGALVWVGLSIMRDPSLAHLAAPSRLLGPSNYHSHQCGAFCHPPVPRDPSGETTAHDGSAFPLENYNVLATRIQ